MGGLREYTDPNFLCFGGPVPEKYYKVNDDTYEKVTVAAGAVYVRRHEVAERGSTLAWDFFTTDNDIGFGVFYVPPGADEADRSAHRAIVALERVNAHNDRSVRPSVCLHARWPRVLTSESERTIRAGYASRLSSTVTAEEAGVYHLVWDNSYSWVNSKSLNVKSEVVRPDETA